MKTIHLPIAHHGGAQWTTPAEFISSRNRGFTMVEIMVVAVIVGLLAIMAMPAFQKAREQAQNTRITNDLRVFKQGFANYSLENGEWPPEAAAGVLPPEMAGYLGNTVFETRTLVGGRYDWNFQDGSFEASIALTGTFMDDPQAESIDLKLDDGNLATGEFQANGADYVLILEP